MSITITPENIYIGIILILMGMQIHHSIKLDKAKKEIKQIWDQISIFNTMVAMKLLENQKELNKLKEKNNDTTKEI